MEWTKTRPSVKGYYWYKSDDNEEIYIINVYYGPDLDYANERIFNEDWYYQHIDNKRSYNINLLDGEFFGPLEAPSHDNKNEDTTVEDTTVDDRQLWQDFFKLSIVSSMEKSIPYKTGRIEGGYFVRDLDMTTNYASKLADNMLRCYRQRFPKG